MKRYFAFLWFVAAPIAIAIFVVAFSRISFTPKYAQERVNTTLIPPLSPTPVTATENAKGEVSNLQKYLTVEAALLGVSDSISVFFKDLTSDQEISIDPTKSWIPASTIKAYVILEAFRQRRVGVIDFNRSVTIIAQNVVPTELETDDCPRLREGAAVTIGQLVECMITQSDNTAYNTLLDILDRRNINDTLRTIGITETVVGEKLNLDDSQLQTDLAVPGRQPNSTTAKDLATFFDYLYTKHFPESEEILAIFKRQKINDMIPALLPQGTVIAHKTGDWAPIYHDGGVIYKPNNPFVLSIFTNGNNPHVLSQLSRVAYFQDPKVVGAADTPQKINMRKRGETIELAVKPDVRVLGVSTPEKFPQITAADLGVTARDIAIDKEDAQKIKPALVPPGSILYPIKQLIELWQLQMVPENKKFSLYLSLATNRLAEIKALTNIRDTSSVGTLLNESEDNLKQAAAIAKAQANNDASLIQMKHMRDLHFAVLSDVGERVAGSQKEQFVNSVYALYDRQQREVVPLVRSSLAANPLGQQPEIGTIATVTSDKATIRFETGETKDILLTDKTPVRAFRQENVEGASSLTVGSKIAVVAQTNKEGKLLPLFILRDIPKELPDKHTGIVVKINPGESTLEIQNRAGQTETVTVDENTVIKAKDTGVSLEGIKAGSQVTVFGQSDHSQTQAPKQGQSASIEVKATTVTVTKNASGAQEKVERKKEKEKEKPKEEPAAKPPEQPKPRPAEEKKK